MPTPHSQEGRAGRRESWHSRRGAAAGRGPGPRPGPWASRTGAFGPSNLGCSTSEIPPQVALDGLGARSGARCCAMWKAPPTGSCKAPGRVPHAKETWQATPRRGLRFITTTMRNLTPSRGLVLYGPWLLARPAARSSVTPHRAALRARVPITAPEAAASAPQAGSTRRECPKRSRV